MASSRTFLASAVALLCSLSAPGAAHASPEATSVAESLLRSGTDAYQRGDYQTACPRLAESQRLEPAGGTLLTLALCYEAWGQHATAWTLFQQAEAVARNEGRDDRATLAEQRARALEASLSFLTVELSTDAPEDVEVVLDWQPLGAASLGVRTAVDTGEHRVEARVDGAVYFTRAVTLAATDSVTVQVPKPPAPRPVAQSTPGILESVAPAALFGVGLGVVAAGGYFGVRAYRLNRKVEAGCPKEPCSLALRGTHESARRNATLSNVAVGSGLLVAAGGLYWLLSSKPASDARVRTMNVLVAPHAAHASIEATF